VNGDGFVALCSSIRTNITLTQLRLACNNIKNEQAEFLAAVLETKRDQADKLSAESGIAAGKRDDDREMSKPVTTMLSNLDLNNNEIYNEVLGRLKIAAQRIGCALECAAIGRFGASQ
jgi:hypothetical protein